MDANDSSNEIKYDPRMSAESRLFVREFLKMAKQSDITKVDLKIVRNFRDQQARELISKFKFENLKISEATVLNEGEEIKIVKFEPKEPTRNDTPITVFFHGGGFALGSTLTHYLSVARLAAITQSIWISVEYRLCPEHHYPTPVSDCRAVVKWAYDNKSQLSSKTAKLGISGDSSGGHVASIIAHELKHLLDYQILIYPCVSYGAPYPSYKEFESECYLLTPETMKFFFKCLGPNPEQHREHLSVIDYKDYSNLPKCLIIAAELDPLIDDSKFYAQKLRDNSIECTLVVIPGIIHGYFSQPVAFKDAFKTTEESVEKFFKELL